MKKYTLVLFAVITVFCVGCGSTKNAVTEINGEFADTLLACRQIRVMGLGSALYAPSTLPEYAHHSATAILKLNANFGTKTTSVVKVKGGIYIVEGCPPSLCVLTVGFIEAQNPDIIVLGGNYFSSMNAEVFNNTLNALDYFVKKKHGVLLAFCESERVAALVNRICGSAVSVVLGNAAGSTYSFRFIEDPVLNGVFGDLRSRYWGEDATITATLNYLPDSTVALSFGNSIYRSQVTALRHNSLGFIWVGDGGFLADNESGEPEISNPCRQNTGVPAPQTNYNPPVYNSVFYANAIVWAIEYKLKNK